MNTQRGPTQNNFIAKAQSKGSGNSSQRGARPEWNKPMATQKVNLPKSSEKQQKTHYDLSAECTQNAMKNGAANLFVINTLNIMQPQSSNESSGHQHFMLDKNSHMISMKNAGGKQQNSTIYQNSRTIDFNKKLANLTGEVISNENGEGHSTHQETAFDKKKHGKNTIQSKHQNQNIEILKMNHQTMIEHEEENHFIDTDSDEQDVNELIPFRYQTFSAKSQDPTPKQMQGNRQEYSQQQFQSNQNLKLLDNRTLIPLQSINNQIIQNNNFPQTTSNLNFSSKITSKKDRQNKNASQNRPSHSSVLVNNCAQKTLNVNLNNKESCLSIGAKTPSDIFQYKIKSVNQTCNKNTNLNKDDQQQLLIYSGSKSNKSNFSIKSDFQNQMKGQINQKQNTKEGIALQKQESQESFFQQSAGSNFEHINFMYNTQQPPPNSLNNDMMQISGEPSHKPSIIIKDEEQPNVADFDLKVTDQSTSSIRVVARFRPLNQTEKELKESIYNQEEMITFFDDQKTLKVKEDYYSSTNNIYTFDNILSPIVSQAEVFETFGKDTIDDIMAGYNGTIFAYGQTGSGKTFSMYGADIYDEILMGIVPRAARQIFNFIREQDLEVEYQIKAQMVEIYKETLCDLLYDSPNNGPELKIKEDPKRGTYVEGLTEVCIVSEEEIMEVIYSGEKLRHIASTKLNKTSSRSHSICIIEIIQKFPNDSEKRGVLNLVDLAGSERISKSHAQGQALEEAKKINQSLSNLGKVINCLTKKDKHIPYRDSKLTRLLKESLGGNNKTTLLVACSMHQSNIEETISSLRFARRAKCIKNNIKMNVKSSPEQLQEIIIKLKYELRTAHEEICKLRVISTVQHSGQRSAIDFKQEDFMFRTCDPNFSNQISLSGSKIIMDNNNSNNNFNNSNMQLHNRPHQSLLSKNYDVIETNNIKMQMLSQFSSEFSYIPMAGGNQSVQSPIKAYEDKIIKMINRNDFLEMRLRSKKQDIQVLEQDKIELQNKVSSLDEKVLSYKQRLLVLEQKVADFESDKDIMGVKQVKQTYKLEDYHIKIDVLTQQVKCLENALEESEQNCQDLLREKQSNHSKQFKDFIKDTIKICRVSVSDALDNFIKKDQNEMALKIRRSFISQHNLEQDYQNQQDLISKGQISISLRDQDLFKENLYSVELVNAIEEGSIPPEIIIYLLKHLLIDNALQNHNLQRILAINKWRQVLEFGKGKIKSELCKIQENTIETLEQILEKTRKTHDGLRNRVDKLEYQLYDNKQCTQNNKNNGDAIQLIESVAPREDENMKPMITRVNTNPVIGSMNNNGVSNTNQLNNVNSSLSLAFVSGSQSVNHKSRFVKTITNKTLGKGFNFAERSPLSRASLAGGLANNMSILSQYYGHNNNNGAYGQTVTPLRTQGVNSPVIFNFQSPTRRKSAFVYQMKSQNGQNNTMNNYGQAIEDKVVKMSDNAPQTFEEAIGRICYSNQNEVKNQQMVSGEEKLITTEDLKLIDGMKSADEIKEFIRSKVQTNKINTNLQPMFAQYQNAQNQLGNQTNPQQVTSSQIDKQFSKQQQIQQQVQNPSTSQINNNTTKNNNLYGSSNDYYVDHQGVSQSSNNIPLSDNILLHDPQARQEHVQTLASDYLITSNSIIGGSGQNGFLGGGLGFHFYQNDYFDRLQEKIVQLQEEVDTQKCRAEEHKKAYYESKRQIEQIRQLMEDKESNHNLIMKQEISSWENALNKLKEVNEGELIRKQKKIQELNTILAQWIENYQLLELNKGIKPQELEQLLVETLSHKRGQSIYSTANVLDPTQTSQLHPQTTTMHDRQMLQVSLFNKDFPQSSSREHTRQKDSVQYSSQAYSGLLTIPNQDYLSTVQIMKQQINGDNSPVQQEESYLDIEQQSNVNLFSENNMCGYSNKSMGEGENLMMTVGNDNDNIFEDINNISLSKLQVMFDRE